MVGSLRMTPVAPLIGGQFTDDPGCPDGQAADGREEGSVEGVGEVHPRLYAEHHQAHQQHDP